MNIFQQRTKLAAVKHIHDYEEGNRKITFYKYLINSNISKKVAKEMIQHFETCILEVTDAINKTDSQAVEAYRLYDKKGLDKLLETYYTLKADTFKYIEERDKYKVIKRRKKRINTDDTSEGKNEKNSRRSQRIK